MFKENTPTCLNVKIEHDPVLIRKEETLRGKTGRVMADNNPADYGGKLRQPQTYLSFCKPVSINNR